MQLCSTNPDLTKSSSEQGVALII